MALWREVIGYEGLYLVSNEGQIVSLPRKVFNGRGEYIREGCIMKQSLRGREPMMYSCVELRKDNESKRLAVHRIVAEAFVDNPNDYEFVNHIDHNPLNNHSDNLEWCTQQYNNEYGHNKPVKQYTAGGEFIAEYKNITYASQMTGIGRRAINNALTGYTETSGGYIWEYSDNGEGE